MAKNAVQMGFKPDILSLDESSSPFKQFGPSQYASYAQNLEPTSVQQKMHYPWLDAFPFPRFTHNFIQAVAASLMDLDKICVDVAEMKHNRIARPSLIVWRNLAILAAVKHRSHIFANWVGHYEAVWRYWTRQTNCRKGRVKMTFNGMMLRCMEEVTIIGVFCYR